MKILTQFSERTLAARAAHYNTLTEAQIASLSTAELLELTTDPLFAPTQANYPVVKHFFPCSEAAGASAMVDSFGGLSIPCTVTKANAYANGFGGTLTNVSVTGTMASIMTANAAVVFAVADHHTAAIMSIGGSSTHKVSIGATTSNYMKGASVQSSGGSNSSSTDGVIKAFGVLKDTSNALGGGANIRPFDIVSSTTTTGAGVAIGSLSDVDPAGTATPVVFSGSSSLLKVHEYSTMVFATALPANILSYIKIMSEWAQAGHKVIHPALKMVS